ncbi:uncharacterized protein LOC115376460 [Myripristis murdjan]|uniref:uncharacterized protein LOC115376460 n=1 Tax=Myripristis murdjan TaxID=586833 RepID=UPI0011763935|nr:uncharacterized protein LOC115376460 [Myripristis murdjan]
MLLLLSCCIIAGIAANEAQVVQYGLKNSSVCLHVGESAVNLRVDWSFKKRYIILNRKFNPNYTERADYHPGNGSLCIKKLAESDNGVYDAEAPKGFDKLTWEFLLIVQETVPEPDIRVTVLLSNESADFCTIMVNCSIQDSWAFTVCNQDRCPVSQRSFGTINITISLTSTTVVCHGNNHVSTSKSSKRLDKTCFKDQDFKTIIKNTWPEGAVLLSILALFLVLSCVLIILVKRYHSSKEWNNQQAETATQVERLSVEAQPAADNEPSSCQPVRVHEVSHITTSTPGAGAGPDLKADSVYCVLQLPFAAASLDKRGNKKDGKGQEKTDSPDAEGTSTCSKVCYESRNQSRVNMSARERSEDLSQSLYATVQPVKPRSASPVATGKPSLHGDGDGDGDAEAVQCHQEARGSSATPERTQLPETETVYSVAQWPRHPARSERPPQARGDYQGRGVDT